MCFDRVSVGGDGEMRCDAMESGRLASMGQWRNDALKFVLIKGSQRGCWFLLNYYARLAQLLNIAILGR